MGRFRGGVRGRGGFFIGTIDTVGWSGNAPGNAPSRGVNLARGGNHCLGAH